MLIEGELFLALLATGALTLGHFGFELGVDEGSPVRLLPILERGFAKLAAGFCAVSWIGMTLAEVGWFGQAGLLLGTWLPALALGALTWRRHGRLASSPNLEFGYSPAVLLVLGALAANLYFPAFDAFFVARDFGVYQVTGIHLAKEGSIAWNDPLVAEMPAEEQDYFFPRLSGRGFESNRLMGFYLEDVETGRVVPQSLPIFPVWVGVGYLTAGLSGATAAAPLLALLAAVALYYLGRRLAHPLVGAVAAGLLAAGFVQAWFARSGAAELAAQSLVLVACYALALERRHGDRFFAALAGVAFALTWVTKAELVVLAAPLAGLLVVDVLRGEHMRRRAVWLWGSMLVVGTHVVVHWRGWVWPYVSDLFRVVELPPWTLASVVAAAVAVLALATWLAPRVSSEVRESSDKFLRGADGAGRAARLGSIVVVLAAAGYAYWIRPLEATWDSHSFVELGWAISPAALLLAVVGLVLYLGGRRPLRGFGAVTAILLSVSLAVLWRRLVFPGLFWALRRYLPTVLPVTCLLVGYAVWRLGRDGPGWLAGARAGGSAGEKRPRESGEGRHAMARAVVLAGLGSLGILGFTHLAGHAAFYQPQEDMPGSRAFLRRLDAVFEDRALVVFEPRTRRGLLRMEAATQFLLDHPTVRLVQPEVSELHLLNLVRRTARQGRAAYLVTTGYLGFFMVPRAEPAARLHFRTSILEETPKRLPGEREVLNIEADVYRLYPNGDNRIVTGRLEFDGSSALYLGETGWGTAEIQQPSGMSFRWTRERARVYLPGLTPEAGELRLSLGSDMPDAVGPQRLVLSLDGLPLGRLELGWGWRVYRLPLPERWRPGRAPVLELHTSTWSPADHFNPDDPRQLGVKVDWIAWGDAEPRP